MDGGPHTICFMPPASFDVTVLMHHAPGVIRSKAPIHTSTWFMTVRTRQTRHIYPMFEQRWSNVVDGGPSLDKHWVDVSCLLGERYSGHL